MFVPHLVLLCGDAELEYSISGGQHISEIQHEIIYGWPLILTFLGIGIDITFHHMSLIR